MKFYPADFLMDVQQLSMVERGIWMTLLCHIWFQSTDGTISLDVVQLTSIIGHRNEDLEAFFHLKSIGVADIEEVELPAYPFKRFTIHSRRIERDKKDLKMNALYVSKHRSKVVCKTNVRDKKFRSSEVIKDKDNYLVVPAENGAGPTPDGLVKLWNNAAHPNLPRAKEMNESRKRSARARLVDHPEKQFWLDLLAKINASPLLTGQKGTWRCSFDWILSPTNLTKILEGNYDGK